MGQWVKCTCCTNIKTQVLTDIYGLVIWWKSLHFFVFVFLKYIWGLFTLKSFNLAKYLAWSFLRPVYMSWFNTTMFKEMACELLKLRSPLVLYITSWRTKDLRGVGPVTWEELAFQSEAREQPMSLIMYSGRRTPMSESDLPTLKY